jgi:hypothetical protein
VFARSQADAAPWRVELDLDADAGGMLVLEEPAGAVWQAGEADTDGGVLVRPLGKGVRLTASTAGRQRVVVNLLPHTERRGGLETAEMRLPGTPAAAIHLVGEPLSANAVACEFAAAGRPFLRAPLVDATSRAPVFAVSGAERVRLVRPLDPRDRIAAEPTAATTVNDVFWGLDACTVQTTLTLDAADLLPAVLLRADERLEKMEVVDADAAVIQAVGPGRWRLELSRANRGKTVVTLASRMPRSSASEPARPPSTTGPSSVTQPATSMPNAESSCRARPPAATRAAVSRALARSSTARTPPRCLIDPGRSAWPGRGRSTSSSRSSL